MSDNDRTPTRPESRARNLVDLGAPISNPGLDSISDLSEGMRQEVDDGVNRGGSSLFGGRLSSVLKAGAFAGIWTVAGGGLIGDAENVAYAEEICTDKNNDGEIDPETECLVILRPPEETNPPSSTSPPNNNNNNNNNSGAGSANTAAPTPSYAQTVAEDCIAEPDNPVFAEELLKLKDEDGSSHLVDVAEYCGVTFLEDPEADAYSEVTFQNANGADVVRPISYLEIAVESGDDPKTRANDDITANADQVARVITGANEAWIEQHPEAAAVVTTTTSTSTTTIVEATTTTDSGPSVTDTQSPISVSAESADSVVDTTSSVGRGHEKGGDSNNILYGGLGLGAVAAAIGAAVLARRRRDSDHE